MIKQEDNFTKILKGKTFIDLFCGLGGFRLALESFGGKCVFGSDIDKYVSETYADNFGDNPLSDITKVDEKQIPPHNILCAGFPCQAFSISGKQKGFDDTRGTLFREVVRIAKYHKPEILLLENVKNLQNHDGGKTFEIIKNDIEAIGYNMYYKVLNASNYGIPQARERLYMVCIRRDIDNKKFEFPSPVSISKCVNDILLHTGEEEKFVIEKGYRLHHRETSPLKIYKKPLRIGTVNKGGQGDRIYDICGQAITLSAEGGGTGSKTGLYLADGKVRKLHPRECARLMGYPESYKINPSDNQAFKQFGNSVVVDVLQYIIQSLIASGVKI